MEEDTVPLLVRSSEEETKEGVEEGQSRNHLNTKTCRNYCAFFMLGFMCNATYNVVLAAAFDLMALSDEKRVTENGKNRSGFNCNKHSTATVLFAAIFPGLLLKYCAPYFIHLFSYHCRFIFIITTGMLSVLLPGTSKNVYVILFGVGFASISSCLSEITCLSLSHIFPKNALKIFASGTGFCYTVSFVYAATTTAGVLPQTAILIFLWVPALQVVTFWIVLKLPSDLKAPCVDKNSQKKNVITSMSLSEKFVRITRLWAYMLPLFLV